MAKWRYKLVCGKALREAIDEEDNDRVLDMITEAWKEINKHFPEEYDTTDLENDIEEIESIREDPDEDSINYLLSELYDYCDNARIWVSI